MNCEKARQYRDDYLDDCLVEREKNSVRQHLDLCPRCRHVFNRDAEMLRALRSLPVPPPSPGFVERSFSKAGARSRKPPQKWLIPSWAGALAASLILWLSIGMPHLPGHRTAEAPAAAVTITINEQKTVKLVVNAPRDLLNAQVTIELPSQVEMVGFPGSSEIAWTTNLRKGKNLLSLPLVAKSAGEVKLVTRINHENKSKLLRFDMKIQNNTTGFLHQAIYMV
ncbi:MAG: zf-HC2 domain-containing protein [Deltaproteobacteria bacterium]|nr:zf-HC2 domain-containing protein [Deltaproteobacteria bacterium]